MEVRRCRLDLRTWIQPHKEPWKGRHWASRELGILGPGLCPCFLRLWQFSALWLPCPHLSQGVVCCALLAWQLSLHGSVIHPSTSGVLLWGSGLCAWLGDSSSCLSPSLVSPWLTVSGAEANL